MRTLFVIIALTASTVANAQSFNTTITRHGGQTYIDTRMSPRYEPAPSVIYVPKPTDADDARSRDRDAAWRQRCDPVVGPPDANGIRRYSYRATGCEFGD